MNCCVSELLGVGAGAGESLWRLCRSRALHRTSGGSDAPEPLHMAALRAGAHAAERGGEVVHGEAVGAKLVRGGEMLANVSGGNRRGVGEARENEQTVGGKFARIFRRGIVARRQGAGQHLDEARTGRCLQPSHGFDFAGRDEARNRHPAMLRLVDDLANGRFVLGDALLEREAHVEEKGRAEQGEIAHALPAARRQALQQLRVDVGVAEKAIGVRELPEPARRVELDVMANGAQHRGGEGELDIGAAVEAGETLNCRGIWRPRTLPMVVGPALLDGGHQYVAEDSWQDGVSAENKDIFNWVAD